MAALRVIAGVSIAWLLAAIAWAAQSSLGASLSGGNSLAFGMAVRSTLVQAMAWIPVTLAVILIATRFPFKRWSPVQSVLLHLSFAAVLAFAANVLVVLGFWTIAIPFLGFFVTSLIAFWALIAVANYDRIPIRTAVVYAVCGAIIVAGFYFLMSDVLLIRMPRGILF